MFGLSWSLSLVFAVADVDENAEVDNLNLLQIQKHAVVDHSMGYGDHPGSEWKTTWGSRTPGMVCWEDPHCPLPGLTEGEQFKAPFETPGKLAQQIVVEYMGKKDGCNEITRCVTSLDGGGFRGFFPLGTFPAEYNLKQRAPIKEIYSGHEFYNTSERKIFSAGETCETFEQSDLMRNHRFGGGTGSPLGRGVAVWAETQDEYIQWQVMMCPHMTSWTKSQTNQFYTIGHAIKIGTDVFELRAPEKNTFRKGGGFVGRAGTNCGPEALIADVNGEPVKCNSKIYETEHAVMYQMAPDASEYTIVSKDKKFMIMLQIRASWVRGAVYDEPLIWGHIKFNTIAHPMKIQDGSTCGHHNEVQDWMTMKKSDPAFDISKQKNGYLLHDQHTMGCPSLVDYRQTKDPTKSIRWVGKQSPSKDYTWQAWPESKVGGGKTQKWAGYDGVAPLFRKEFVQDMCQHCNIGSSFLESNFKECMGPQANGMDNSKCPADTMTWATTTTTTTTMTTTTTTLCESNPAFELKTPSYSNLGGKGPDAGVEGMLFPNAGTIRGVAVDVKMVAVDSYQPFNTAKNGITGDMGSVSLSLGSSTSFDFILLESGTENPITVDGMGITFLDLDEGKRGRGRSTVKVCDASLTVPDGTELTVSNEGSCSSVSSTKKGSAKNNPTSSVALTDDHKKRIATFQYGGGSSFRASLGLAPKGTTGRNFNFAFAPVVECAP